MEKEKKISILDDYQILVLSISVPTIFSFIIVLPIQIVILTSIIIKTREVICITTKLHLVKNSNQVYNIRKTRDDMDIDRPIFVLFCFTT
jgi:hypothetical protein